MMRNRIAHWLQGRGFRDVIIGLPYLWLLLFFFIPFCLVLAISFGSRTPTAPPFGYGGEHPWISFVGYSRLFHDDLYIRAFLVSLSNAAVATVLCLTLGYPMSLALTRVSASWRNILLMLVDPAVLDLIPAAGLCVDGADGEEFLVQRLADRCL